MKIHQLSLFLENRPGQLHGPIALLAKNGINIRTLMLADTQQFGILRLIVKEWEKAKKLLEDAGHVVNVTQVVAIEVPDRPGGLDEILGILGDSDANVEYMYAFTEGRNNQAVLIFRFEDLDAALAKLEGKDLRFVQVEDILGG